MIVTNWVKYTSTTEQTGLVFPRSQHPRREEIHRFRLAAASLQMSGGRKAIGGARGKNAGKTSSFLGKTLENQCLKLNCQTTT